MLLVMCFSLLQHFCLTTSNWGFEMEKPTSDITVSTLDATVTIVVWNVEELLFVKAETHEDFLQIMKSDQETVWPRGLFALIEVKLLCPQRKQQSTTIDSTF